MTKPGMLRLGSRIAVISPAGTPKEERVHLGCDRLRDMGYEPVIMPSALTQGPLSYAGDVSARVADFHAAFADDAFGAVMCTRGGWGSAELLPYLDADVVRANPKPLVGFSDVTTLHLWLAQNCMLSSFYGPMVSPDFAREAGVAEGVDVRSFESALTRTDPWSVDAREGLRTLRAGHDAQVRGTLFGGCLALLVESLGTPWALQAPEGDGILFVEEVGTHPYQWDRMMLHLRYAGVLERVRGVVFGDMEQCLTATEAVARAREMAVLEAALLHNLREFEGPIAIGLRSGHVNTPNVTLPLGVEAELNLCGEPTLRLIEAAVR